FASNVRHGIEAGGAKAMAAAEARNRQPKSAPRAILVDGFERILRARRQMPAIPADERLQRPAVEVNGQLQRGAKQWSHRHPFAIRPYVVKSRTQSDPTLKSFRALCPESSSPQSPSYRPSGSRRQADGFRSLRRYSLICPRSPRLDLVQRPFDRIEDEQRGSMPCFIVPHRLQNAEIRPPARRRRAVLLQHPTHRPANIAQLLR